jgi:hypothetical protein
MRSLHQLPTSVGNALSDEGNLLNTKLRQEK